MSNKEEEIVYLKRKDKRSRYDKRFILKIVKLIESGVPRKVLEEEYGIHPQSFPRWLEKYGTQGYTRKVLKVYTMAEKRSVVRAVEGGMSLKQAKIAFDIPCGGSIKSWMTLFHTENAELRETNLSEMPKNKVEKPTAGEEALLKELAEANLKIHALNTLIDVAEEKLKINIRKKPGAKQSSR